ncbi:hypothetical protein H9Q08_03650 [Chryseobacterium sp. PS-8]|uniref:Uncharacterized protein n=1 Tax=Chryseobacterium indicum TaxID=2766954 RepID=A0ABS9C375_9FLAO|nr:MULTISPECIES: hypothetical protein [unclassified Chryseobacterium]MCF2218390.1 hypothetical protein [Chryseobacterium sp. PS-8]MCY1662526.1 hypothetical protein [Chryseobacterium sp. SL1]
MDKIKKFLEFLFAKEQEAINYGYFKDKLDEYNKISFEIKSFMNDETVGLGLPLRSGPKSDRYYKTKENSSYPKPRQVFKISEYIHERYGEIWACYVSLGNPDSEKKDISECFLVALIDEELKIISNFIVTSDAKEWRHVGGDEDKSLRLHNLGKPVKVERYLEPTDEWSLEEYLKDK